MDASYKMEPKISRLLIPLLVGFLIEDLLADRIDDFSGVAYEGITTYHAVDSEVVQKKLDDFRSQSGASLFLPDTAIFPENLAEGEHVVFIDFGTVGFHDYAGYKFSNLSVLTPVVGLTIPFLSSHPGGRPQYNLVIGALYQRGSREFANPNFAFPEIPIDELTLRADGAVLRDGEDEMTISLGARTNPCRPPSRRLHHFDELISGDFHVGREEPAFDICDRFPAQNRFCSAVDKIREDVALFGSNFCQTPWTADNMISCEAEAKIISMTTGFQDMLLLGDNPHKFFATEYISVNSTFGIQYPCLIPDVTPC